MHDFHSEDGSTVSAFLVCLPVNVVVETVLRQMSLHLLVLAISGVVLIFKLIFQSPFPMCPTVSDKVL